jgi:macrolide transport system ATP-binding/permease protein
MINLRNVNHSYGNVKALDDVTLHIAKGEFVAIVGTSGSGKTTLMNLLGLLATPQSGQLEIFGQSVEGLTEDDLARLRNVHIGFVFQHFHLLPKLTVLENALLPSRYLEGSQSLAPRQAWETKAIELLTALGLKEHLYKRPQRLSGGQKQRVAIARALLLSPDILLADEPTGALDSKTTKVILEELSHRHRQGTTVLLITHDPKVAAQAHRIIHLKDGRIVKDEVKNQELSGSQQFQGSKESQNFLSPNQSNKTEKHLQSPVFSFAWLRELGHALSQLFVHPTRTFFTLLGLSIGVSSLIIMLTLTTEATAAFRRFFDTKGGRTARLSYDWNQAERTGAPQWQGLHRERDLPVLNSFFASYGRIDPRTEESDCQMQSAYRAATGDVTGVDSLAQFGEAGAQKKQGRLFTPQEINPAQGERELRPVILGSAASQKLFPPGTEGALSNEQYPLGELLTLRGGCPLNLTVKVVGVLEDLDTTFDNSINEGVWIPTATLRKAGSRAFVRSLVAVPHEGIDPTWFSDSLRNYLRIQTQDKFPFRTFVPQQQIQRIEMMLTVLKGLTLVLGSLCVLIGGIGVMNIMLVNIAERVREIGIRKAIGARPAHIKKQFLIESSVLCMLSGLFGVALGTIICNVVYQTASHFLPKYFESQFVWNQSAVLLALGVSVASGFGFGLLPARRASTFDVVESLRQE